MQVAVIPPGLSAVPVPPTITPACYGILMGCLSLLEAGLLEAGIKMDSPLHPSTWTSEQANVCGVNE